MKACVLGLSLLLPIGNAWARQESLYMSVRSSRQSGVSAGGQPAVGLFVSRDAGKTWEHKGWRSQIKVFYTEAGGDGTLWSACGNGVLRSTDGGGTWKITTGPEVTEALKVKVHPGDPGIVFAATAYGIFRSTDRGEAWQARNRGLASTFVSDIVIDAGAGSRLLAATEGGIFASVDQGDRWTLAGLKGKGIRTLRQDPARPRIFWAGTEDDGVYRSGDGGRTWQASNHGAPLQTVYAVAVHPEKPDTIYLGTHEGGVYRSHDGGKSWQQKNAGLKHTVVHALALLPSHPGILFAGTINGGLYRSADGGETWEFNSQAEGQVWGLSASADTAPPPFEARKDRLLAAAARDHHGDFYTVAARLRSGTGIPQALALLDSLVRNESIGGMFYAYGLISAYLHTRDLLPDSLHRKVRQAYRRRTMDRGDTENHWLMYYTGLYLAAQTWPDGDGGPWFNGKTSAENFREAEGWINSWIRLTATRGQGEFDSPTYFQTFAAPMLSLHDFARDPALKKKAGMMLDYLFADFAAEHLRGNYGGGHSRDYPQDIIRPLGALSTKWAWLFFGEPDFEPWSDPRGQSRHPSWETAFAALSSYRMPALILGMATDRSAPYVHTETKRIRNPLRFGERLTPPVDGVRPVYKYTYMTADYVLGSLHGGIAQPIQQHTWDVTFVSDKAHNTLFTLHPYYSGMELATFFPEEQKVLSEEVNKHHLTYISPDKWNGSSPFEQVFQHRNALIALYHIDTAARHPHIDGFFPKSLDERVADSSGWIFCKAGRTYIAFFPLKPYAWKEEEAAWRWRSPALRNGVVVEIGSEKEYGSFPEFRKRFRRAQVGYAGFDRDLTVKYRTQAGAVMGFTHGGKRTLDGKPVDFANYKAFNGPFLRSERGSGVVKLIYKDQSRTLDFN